MVHLSLYLPLNSARCWSEVVLSSANFDVRGPRVALPRERPWRKKLVQCAARSVPEPLESLSARARRFWIRFGSAPQECPCTGLLSVEVACRPCRSAVTTMSAVHIPSDLAEPPPVMLRPTWRR